MQTPALLISLSLAAASVLSPTPATQDQFPPGSNGARPVEAGLALEPTRVDAARVERQSLLRGGLSLFGMQTPFERESLEVIDLLRARGDDAALAHRRAVMFLDALALDAAELPVGRIADPRTLRGPEAVALIAGLLGMEPDRLLDDAWIELAPRRSGRRVTFQLHVDLSAPAEHLESGRLDLRGTFALSSEVRTAYRVEGEGTLSDLVMSARARQDRIGAFDHGLTIALRGIRGNGPTVLAR